MAREQEETPRSHRLIQVAAVAFLASVTALAFGRVFTGRVPTLKLMAAALASTGLAALLERRGALIAALVSAVGLLLMVGWLVMPRSLWFGFPSAHTFHAIGQALKHVGADANNEVAPSPPLHPLLLAAVTAAWTAAFSTHALAIRSGSPLLAAFPQAALLTFTGMALEDGPRYGYVALFIVALAGLLFADGLRRVRQWGSLRPWEGSGRRRLASNTTTRGARRVTAAAVGLALLFPGILPGFRSPSVLAVKGGGGGGGGVDPLVSVTASLKQRHPVELFTVKSSQPLYWRWLSLDRFDGNHWTAPDLDVSHGVTIANGAGIPRPTAAGIETPDPSSLPRGTKTETVTQQIQIEQAPGRWLPAAFAPYDVSVPNGSFRYDPEMAALVPQGGLVAGATYTVNSLVVLPTYNQLDSVGQAVMQSNPATRRYTELPAATLRAVRPIAQRIVAGWRTPFEQILALQQWFRVNGGFRYDISVQAGNDTNYLVKFLTRTKRGFCQQFATAMAVLVRALGYPARIGVGFTAGQRGSDGLYHVTTANAHAWVEVYFPAYGWLPFEPTPGRVDPVTRDITRRPVKKCHTAKCRREQEGNNGRRGHTGPDQRDAHGTGNIRAFKDAFKDIGQKQLGKETGGGGRIASKGVSWRIFAVLALGLLLVAVALVLPFVKAVARRIQLARAKSPRESVLATYRVFASRAADLGLPKSPGETFPEYEARLRSEVRFSDGHLRRLTGAASLAAYAPVAIGEPVAHEATAAARQAIREIRRSRPLTRRIVGLWRPGL